MPNGKSGILRGPKYDLGDRVHLQGGRGKVVGTEYRNGRWFYEVEVRTDMVR